jgi:hypothetical protein
VVALLVLGGGCDDTSTDPDADQAFEGITETDDTGRILGRDPNDFLPRPLGDDDDNVAIPPQHPRAAPQNVSLIGVYPNPAPNGEVTITFQLTGTAHVDLLLYPGPGEDPLSLLSESRGAGFHQELYVAPILGVISRVELRVNANVFGGDIQF